MNCVGCVSNWVRVRDGSMESLCVLDGRRNYGVVECNFFFSGEVGVVEEKKEVMGEVVDLGYGAVPGKKGWPLGKKRRKQ